jgi:REP element-mobilizing transposase RayT
MFEVVVGLGTLTLIFLVMSILIANRYLALHQEVRAMERYSEDLKRNNENLKCSVTALKAENDRLHILVYCNPELERMTALKMALHLKNEENEELREKVRKQNQLLKQKWEGSKKCI